MAVSPDDRFAGLITSSAERGGWVPGDVITSDAAGEEEPVATRRVRLPVLIALALATMAVLVLAFFVLRPTEPQSAPATQSETVPTQAADGRDGAGQERADPAPEVVAHVTGEVENPSVVTLSGGARVRDAVEAAGGLTPDADAEAVNLARLVTDGEQIRIPALGEEPPEQTSGEGSAAAQGAGGSAADGSGPAPPRDGAGGAPGGRIDLNTADSTTLQTLPGVGPVTAEAIIAHREATPFTTVEDLLLIKGIGPKTFESLKDLVTVG